MTRPPQVLLVVTARVQRLMWKYEGLELRDDPQERGGADRADVPGGRRDGAGAVRARAPATRPRSPRCPGSTRWSSRASPTSCSVGPTGRARMMFRRQALRQLEAPEQLDDVGPAGHRPRVAAHVALTDRRRRPGAGRCTARWPHRQAAGVLIHSNGISGLDATASGQIVKVWAAATSGSPRAPRSTAAGRPTGRSGPSTRAVGRLRGQPGSSTRAQLVQPGTRVAEMERLDAPGDALQAVVFVAGQLRAAAAGRRPVEVVGRGGARHRLRHPARPVSPPSARSRRREDVAARVPRQRARRAGRCSPAAASCGSRCRCRPTRPRPAGCTGRRRRRRSSSTPPAGSPPVFTVAREHPIDWLLGR